MPGRLFEKMHFEWKHIIVLFAILIVFQVLVSYIHSLSVSELQNQILDWYKKDSAERLANLSTTSLELLLETGRQDEPPTDTEARTMIRAFNIILSQQLLQENVEEMCILVYAREGIYAIDNGQALFDFVYRQDGAAPFSEQSHENAIRLYSGLHEDLRKNERIYTFSGEDEQFHVFVPLVPNGEFSGAVYVRIQPDFSFLTQQVNTSYNETTLVFTALIVFGLLGMFYISTYTIRERDEAQQALFREREHYLREHITHEKESMFTKRIYHTHHKAEKVMGFIKEDLKRLEQSNIDDVRYRVGKYANFISRVIYDMKWYDPPVHTIRNPLFKTNINEVIRFIVDNIFMRLSGNVERLRFELELDENFPVVQVNEFVVWEVIEPLLQNSLDHAAAEDTVITVKTIANEQTVIAIEDNGKGINPELLEEDEFGVKKIFQENISTKTNSRNSGYGCYLSFEIAKRCGWRIDAENLQGKGCRFTIDINPKRNEK